MKIHHILGLACFWTVVRADCGICPIEHLTRREDVLQAQAYNAMPKTWKPYSVQETQKGFLKGRYAYGPIYCPTECKAILERTTRCRIGFPIFGVMDAECAKYGRDLYDRACTQPPQWDSYYGMWCRTAYNGTVWKWGYTHYPICPSTQQMCTCVHQTNHAELALHSLTYWISRKSSN